jgi:hypothetical protein
VFMIITFFYWLNWNSFTWPNGNCILICCAQWLRGLRFIHKVSQLCTHYFLRLTLHCVLVTKMSGSQAFSSIIFCFTSQVISYVNRMSQHTCFHSSLPSDVSTIWHRKWIFICHRRF